MKCLTRYINEGLFDIESNIGSANKSTWIQQHCSDGFYNNIPTDVIEESPDGGVRIMGPKKMGVFYIDIDAAPPFPLYARCTNFEAINVSDLSNITCTDVFSSSMSVKFTKYKGGKVDVPASMLYQARTLYFEKCKNVEFRIKELAPKLNKIVFKNCNNVTLKGIYNISELTLTNSEDINCSNLQDIEILNYDKCNIMKDMLICPVLRHINTMWFSKCKVNWMPDIIKKTDILDSDHNIYSSTALLDKCEPDLITSFLSDKFTSLEPSTFAGKITSCTRTPQLRHTEKYKYFPKVNQ